MGLLILVAMTLAATAHAAPTTQPAADSSGATELIAQLRADDWATRQRAEDDLVRLGARVAPQVQEAAARASDLEVRTRLRTVLARIERDKAFGTSHISLRLKSVTAPEILAEMSRQCGAPVRINDSSAQNEARQDFTFDNEPFWSALAAVCEAFDLFPYESGENTAGLLLTSGSGRQMKSPRFAHGPFMVVLQSVQHSHSVDLAEPQAVQSHSYLQMLVMAEPKLTILGHSYMPNIERVENEDGRTLLMPNEYAGYGSGGGRVWSSTIPLQPLAAKSRKIATLKGSLSALVQVRAQTVEVNDLSEVQEQSHTVGPRRIILHEVAERDGQYVLRVTVFHTRQEMMDGAQSLIQGLRVFDEKGRPFQMGGSGGRNFEEHKSEFDVYIGRQSPDGTQLKKPAKLVWTIPTETRELHIPFEFRDIPLQ